MQYYSTLETQLLCQPRNTQPTTLQPRAVPWRVELSSGPIHNN